MDREAIEKLFRSLARSQGFYGRLLRDLEDNEEAWAMLEAQNFKSDIEVIMYIECA